MAPMRIDVRRPRQSDAYADTRAAKRAVTLRLAIKMAGGAIIQISAPKGREKYSKQTWLDGMDSCRGMLDLLAGDGFAVYTVNERGLDLEGGGNSL
jgi:hypothetical protein